MPVFDETAFAAGLQALKIKFQDGLPARIAVITHAVSCQEQGWQYDEQLMDELHRLAGAAGSLGEEELASAARSLELLLKQTPHGVALPADLLVPLLQAAKLWGG